MTRAKPLTTCMIRLIRSPRLPRRLRVRPRTRLVPGGRRRRMPHRRLTRTALVHSFVLPDGHRYTRFRTGPRHRSGSGEESAHVRATARGLVEHRRPGGRRARSALFAGELEPGTLLREQPLAAALGVARSTIREAMALLVTEGLAVCEPNKGVSVASLRPAGGRGPLPGPVRAGVGRCAAGSRPTKRRANGSAPR